MLIGLHFSLAVVDDKLPFAGRRAIHAVSRSGVKAVSNFPGQTDPCEGPRIEKYRRGA